MAQRLRIGVAITETNVCEVTQVQAILYSMPVLTRPLGTTSRPAFTSTETAMLMLFAACWGYRMHTRGRSEEAEKCRSPAAAPTSGSSSALWYIAENAADQLPERLYYERICAADVANGLATSETYCCLLVDTWYALFENIQLVWALGYDFFFALGGSRLVALNAEARTTGQFYAVQTLAFPISSFEQFQHV